MKRTVPIIVALLFGPPALAQQPEVGERKPTVDCKITPAKCIGTFPWKPSSGTDGISDAIKNTDKDDLRKMDQQKTNIQGIDKNVIDNLKF
ncbi:hypothetical protein LB554_29360 [Mesorhizobium sp. CO1-1-11]|uniref:hypothetical protein n=1 Tax=Mesorhizobium sp. CO1-1-11 TaxID=2876636 RepID=UPI001CCAC98F|nr:hypothetical protein [Mesorhizobium sp. CO1-1-11]MBZ9728052.1 hypothetical protein [Mesorhizobium sp. CO1-1-11]